MKSGKERYIYGIFTWMAVLCGVIWSFTNLGYDGEYQIAMSYRFLQGDRMFLEMWEPHQTSVFLPAALMWIYMKFFHTTTGIVLYLQICGVLIRGGIACLIYRMLRADLDRTLAYGIALLYFMVSPKDSALPEFSNMQLWYSTLLFCCLWSYLKKQKRYLLALAAICLCLEVLAYPSCAIVLVGAAGILKLYSAHGRRDIFIFAGICAGMGIAAGSYFLLSVGPAVFRDCISGMLALEPTHTGSAASTVLDYLKDLFEMLLVFAAVGGCGFAASRIAKLFLKKKAEDKRAENKKAENRKTENEKKEHEGTETKQYGLWLWLLSCAVIMLAGFLLNILSAENRYAYSVILLFIVGIGLGCRNILEGKEKQIYVCGSVIGGLGFLATLILTDLPLSASVAYGLLAVVSALIPVRKQVEKIPWICIRKGFYGCFFCLTVLLAFRCVCIRTPLTGKGQICSTFSDMSIVRSGPALGIISNEEGVCVQRDSYPEWKEWIQPGDKVWIIGGVVDTLGYLYEEVEVGGPSTMSTPAYSSAVLNYWRLNPDKYPDVIIAESYMGNLTYEILSNQWLMSWLEEEYRAEYVVDGKYWKYYFKKAR